MKKILKKKCVQRVGHKKRFSVIIFFHTIHRQKSVVGKSSSFKFANTGIFRRWELKWPLPKPSNFRPFSFAFWFSSTFKTSCVIFIVFHSSNISLFLAARIRKISTNYCPLKWWTPCHSFINLTVWCVGSWLAISNTRKKSIVTFIRVKLQYSKKIFPCVVIKLSFKKQRKKYNFLFCRFFERAFIGTWENIYIHFC